MDYEDYYIPDPIELENMRADYDSLCKKCDGYGYYPIDASNANEIQVEVVDCDHCNGTGLEPEENQ